MTKYIVLLSLIFAGAANATNGELPHISINCKIKGLAFGIDLDIPLNGKPSVSASYPVTVRNFTFNKQGKLGLVAVDADDTTRTRIYLSAQLAKDGKYYGKMTEDDGGNEIQISRGPVVCVQQPNLARHLRTKTISGDAAEQLGAKIEKTLLQDGVSTPRGPATRVFGTYQGVKVSCDFPWGESKAVQCQVPVDFIAPLLQKVPGTF